MKQTIEMILMTLVMMMMAAFVGSALVGCSSDDDDFHVGDGKNTALSIEEEQHTDTINGWAITRDETDRVTGVHFYTPTIDPIEKLFESPASFDDIRHLFPLSEGNEIRLTDEGEQPPFEGLPDYKQYYEQYVQYYKGVPVAGSTARFYYFITPKGKRMTYGWTGPFKDIKNMDTTPRLSEQQARQVLADYLKVERDDSWPCGIYINEFSFRGNVSIVRIHRLVYSIIGPYAPSDPNVYYFMAPRYMAIVDARTGELLSIN